MKKFIKSRPVRAINKLIRFYFEDGVARSAAELAYYLLFSIFPLLIFLSSAVSRLSLNPDELFSSVNIVLPLEISKIFSDYLRYAAGLRSEILLYSGLFLALFAVSRAIRSLMRSVTRAYGMPQRQGIVYLALSFVLSLLLLAGILLLLIFMVIGNSLLDRLGEYITLSPQFMNIITLLSNIVAPVFLFTVLTAFYYAVGARRYSFRKAMPGAAFFLVIWVVATMLFSYYVSNMSNFSILYGSIGAIMILMLWLYITGMLLILGGAFNRVIAEEFGGEKE